MFVVLEGIINSGKTTVLRELKIKGQRIKTLEFNNLSLEKETISQNFYLEKYRKFSDELEDAKNNDSKVLIVSDYFDGAIAYLQALGKPADALIEEKAFFPEPDYKIFLKFQQKLVVSVMEVE